MEGQEMGMGEPNHAAMEVSAEDMVLTSASARELGGPAPTGGGPTVGGTATGDGKLRPADATRSNFVTPNTTQRHCPQVEWRCNKHKFTLA